MTSVMPLPMDCECPKMTDFMANISMTTTSGDQWAAKNNLNLAKDDTLNAFLEFKVALAIDNYYVPLCSCLGILGNLWSFVTLMSASMRRSTTCQYMAAIALADTVILIFNLLFLIRKIPGYEIFNPWTCRLLLFIFFFSIHFNVSVMIAMTFEKYLAVRFPLKAASWNPKTKLVMSIIAILVCALNTQSLFTRDMIYDDVSETESCQPNSPTSQYFLSKIWPWIDASVYCFIPLTMLFALNILIIIWLNKSEKVRNTMENRQVSSRVPTKSTSTLSVNSNVSTTSSTSTIIPKPKSKESQITRMLLLISFAFLLLVGPMAIIIIVERWFDLKTTPHEAAKYHLTRTVINNLMYTNHSLNFLLYCFSARRFRQATMKVLCCGRQGMNTNSRTKGSTGRLVSLSSTTN